MAGARRGRRSGGIFVRLTWSLAAYRLSQLPHKSRASVRERWQRTTASLILAVQGGLAAALAWFVANNLLHHDQPVFAPIAAVITLDISVGQRLRRAIELVLGVALGIAVADVLILGIGTGAWQIGLVVALATIVIVFLGGTAAIVSQATGSSVLVATLVPPTSGIYYTRVLDALIGGVLAIGVMALLIPTNPLTVISRAFGPALDVLADSLTETAEALTARDARRADAALTRLLEGQSTIDRFRATLPESRETVTIAPLRWRERGALAQYVEAADYVERAMGNAPVLARRAVTLINDQEPIPERLPGSLTMLSNAVRELRRELADAVNPNRTGEVAVQAVRDAADAYQAGLGFSGRVIVAQVRAIATDLLGTAGLSHTDADRLVREAGGNPPGS